MNNLNSNIIDTVKQSENLTTQNQSMMTNPPNNAKVNSSLDLRIQNLTRNLQILDNRIENIVNENKILSVASIIIASGLGSFFTYLFASRIENRKTQIGLNREKEFHSKIRSLVQYELREYQNLLVDLDNKSDKIVTSKDFIERRIKIDNRSEISFKLRSAPRQYFDISPETKLRIFSAESWSKLETAYDEFLKLSNNINQKITEYDIHFSEKDLDRVKDNISLALAVIESNA